MREGFLRCILYFILYKSFLFLVIKYNSIIQQNVIRIHPSALCPLNYQLWKCNVYVNTQNFLRLTVIISCGQKTKQFSIFETHGSMAVSGIKHFNSKQNTWQSRIMKFFFSWTGIESTQPCLNRETGRTCKRSTEQINGPSCKQPKMLPLR